MKIARFLAAATSASVFATNAGFALAQSATGSATKGGTSSSLPSAGVTGITYFLFIFGILMFVFGTLKFIQSVKD